MSNSTPPPTALQLALANAMMEDLELALIRAARVLKDAGLAHYRITLVARHPSPPPGDDGHWIIKGNDDLGAVSALLEKNK